MNYSVEQILLNRFDMTRWRTGFTDNFSHMCVSVDRSVLRLNELSPRGLVEWREPMTEPLCAVTLEKVNSTDGEYPVYISNTEFLPWTVRQTGIAQADNSDFIGVSAALYSPEYNKLIWNLKLKAGNAAAGEYRIKFSGKMRFGEKNHSLRKCENGAVCIFDSSAKHSKYMTYPQSDGIFPLWSVTAENVDFVTADKEKFSYQIVSKPFILAAGNYHTVLLHIEYETLPYDKAEIWQPKKINREICADEEINKRKSAWISLIGLKETENGDTVKTVRSKAGLLRNEFVWNNNIPEKRIVANYCSVTNWSSASFFWDTLISSMGLMYYNMPLAEDAVKSVFYWQREDGCVPTCAYEHTVGSTFYPQAPISAWAAVHMLKHGASMGFIEEIVPKIDKLHRWFTDTQDHDRDGLPEWRFTGCPADNSPLYDNYAQPICKDLNSLWNIYLPPIASVSLASFLIMEAKCLSYLFNKLGNIKKAHEYRKSAETMSGRLVDICLENGEMFYDYDHQTQHFNHALTLYSFLPLWADVPLDSAIKKKIIENYLLNKEYFFGEYPFPHLAYNEEAYRPDGYWRGRVWPHTTLWMLELLWSNGYCDAADEAADRLLKMMSQREEILENYNSSPEMSGGGEPDYSWSYAGYLMIENREYRKPVVDLIKL